MATRVNRKNAAATSPKEVVTTEKASVKNETPSETVSVSTGTAKPIGKRLAKRTTKKIVKKPTLGVKLKAKVQKLKLNPLAKAVLQNTNKKKLLRNGVTAVKPGRKRLQIKKEPEDEDAPPVLEPIFPLEENLLGKKQPKKRVAKKNVKNEAPQLVEITKIKRENEDDESLSSTITESSLIDSPRQTKKTRAIKKPKAESDTLEDVMNDLTYLIKPDEIKKEVDTVSESDRSDTGTKPKKLTKKQKLELIKKNIIKKENLENTLSKLDSADEKIIDMLDLNVNMLKKKSPITRRRHSIEKCPVGPEEPSADTLNVFNHLPRSISPRAKRKGKQESISRRSSPYSTRSDSPARILRNGKQRKLKDMGLLDGLDLDMKKRRRLCSDSGSKLSGYESDSSFSDLASSIGTESNEAIKYEDKDIKPCISSSTASNGPIIDNLGLDSNSNIFNSVETTNANQDGLPDKNVLLDIMKQTFNSEVDLKKANKLKIGTVVPSRFYGTRNTGTSQTKPETDVLKEEVSEKIADEAPVMDDEAQLNLSSAVQDVIESLADNTEDLADGHSLLDNSESLVNDSESLVNNSESSVNNSESSVNNSEIPIVNSLILEDQPEISTEVVEIAPEPILNQELPAHEAIPTEESKEEVTESMDCDDANLKETIDTPVENSPEDPPILQPEPPLDNPMETSEPVPTETGAVDMDNNAENETTVDGSEDLNGTVSDDTSKVDEPVPMELEEISLTDTSNAVIENVEEDLNLRMEESAEKIAEKESILKALGLQRLQAAEEIIRQKTKEKPLSSVCDNYTGTLKTVIKINRDKKKGRNSIKNSVLKVKVKSNTSTEDEVVSEETRERSSKEKEASSSSWKHGTQSSDTAGAHRKSHYSNRSNLGTDGSSEHTSDGETTAQDGAIKALVIPEKASSFSIHPGRLCKDECSYCFGKFGLFDTPCHIAQMKSVDRQNKILATEKHLTRDSCLCDACYRHVDRKSNTPSYMNKSLKRNSLVAPGPKQNHCHVLGCGRESSNILRRKWIIKMRKSICQVINIDLDNPGLHSIPICEEHYAALEHLMICAMCKRRLARNHIHYLGPETTDLNNALNAHGVPLTLSDKPVVCKLCKCFASIVLKDPSERLESSNNFFVEYKKRLLHFNDIVPMDESAADEPIAVPSKAERTDILKKKKKLVKNPAAVTGDSPENVENNLEKREERVPSTDTNSQSHSRSESPSDEYNGVDYTTLIPAIAMDVGSDSEGKKETKAPSIIKNFSEMQREGVEIVKIVRGEKSKPAEPQVHRWASTPSVSVRHLFVGEEDLPLSGNIEFNNVKERTPEGWEKCNTVIQYDEETKRLWQELQKPYGNQSSFLRHLILLEKYFRNGDLVLSPRASHHSINYSESVHNRLRAYDNIPSNAGNIQPLSMLPFNKVANKSNSGIITGGNVLHAMNNSISTQPLLPISTSTTVGKPVGTTAISVTTVPIGTPRSTPLTISQLNSPPLLPANAILQPIRPKMAGQPPGLISLHPGTARPIAPLVKVPQPQKIKFPITKNWRPNLIPIDPTKKQERRAGLVQVISGGKPYHITLEDYKKMCAIKRSFEMKQKRLQEAQAPKPILVTHNSVLKSIIPRKGLVISKTATITGPTIKTELSNMPNLMEGFPEGENSLEKLDKQVEKLESKLNEKSSLLLPRIPKSLTVIPQTVTRKPSRPTSPVLLITPKNSSSKS